MEDLPPALLGVPALTSGAPGRVHLDGIIWPLAVRQGLQCLCLQASEHHLGFACDTCCMRPKLKSLSRCRTAPVQTFTSVGSAASPTAVSTARHRWQALSRSLRAWTPALLLRRQARL